jgi:hypothetical protein
VRPVTGLPSDGERVVLVLPVGEHAVIVSERTCASCRPPGPEVYGIWRGSTTAVRLGTAQEVVAARDGRAVWLVGHQTTSACTLNEIGLEGRLRRPARPVSCTTKLLGELPAGLLVASGPSEDSWDRPTGLVDQRGHRTRLGFPAADLLAATGEQGTDQRRAAGPAHPDQPPQPGQLAAWLAESAAWRDPHRCRPSQRPAHRRRVPRPGRSG